MAKQQTSTINRIVKEGVSMSKQIEVLQNRRVILGERLESLIIQHIESKRTLKIGDRCMVFINGIKREVAIAGYRKSRTYGQYLFGEKESAREDSLNAMLMQEPSYSCYAVTRNGLTQNTEYHFAESELELIKQSTKK